MKRIKDQIRISPSDLVNFLGCDHLTELDRKEALGDLDKPDWNNPAVAILHKKGEDHETAYLKSLRDQGLKIIDLGKNYSIEATRKAMLAGYDVIYQAPLVQGRWFGIADFLARKDGKSAFGAYEYEVEDAKLAMETKAVTVIQLCFYSEIVAELQEKEPEEMKVVKPSVSGGFDFDTFRFAEFQSYYKYVKNRFVNVMDGDPRETYPLPVSRCEICRWWKTCDKKWHDDDHLSLIAGIRSSQLKELENQDFSTLKEYADFDQPLKRKPEKGNESSYQRLHGQSRIQLKGRKTRQLEYKLLEVESFRGLNRLAESSPGDVYFDIEGDHFYEDGGLEYLLGWAYRNEEGERTYQGKWALKRIDERSAFEEFMDFIMNRWKEFPDFYIYHFAPYEPSAIKRLASRHATREVEVDQLLRAERFIDLHTIIKESLQASVESYSLKEMEGFTDYVRKANLFEAAGARRKIGLALDLRLPEKIGETDKQIVEVYNQDDCLATEGLHRWLESVYQNAQNEGWGLERPELKTGDASEQIDERDIRSKELYDGLVAALSDDPDHWNESEKAKWLLAHMVEYFRRENRSKYWEYFHLKKDVNDFEMLDERHGISFLEFVSEFKPQRGNPIHKYKFPPQEVSISAPEKGIEEVQGGVIGEIVSISPEEGWVEIKKPRNSINIHPSAIHTGRPIDTEIMANSLHAFTGSVIEDGLEDRDFFAAAKDLLLCNPPRLKDNIPFVIEGEDTQTAAIRIVNHLDNSVLPIQGPPGTGKTYIGSQMIIDLFQKGKRIGVTAVSHKVIRNLLDKALELGKKEGKPIKAAHKPSVLSEEELPKGLEEVNSNQDAFDALDQGKVLGGTSWLWARDEAEGILDYLFVDEAGQMSLSNVIACSRAAKNIILLGDPQQLEQPQQGAHPEGAEVSALNHILGEDKTMPKEKGLFLDTTRRLPPSIASFTSEQYYENRMQSLPGLEHQAIIGESPLAGNGLFYVPVLHEGNQNNSKEEVEAIVKIVNDLINAGLKWRDRERKEFGITQEDILIVAPYNAQVSALIQRMPGINIGTVDKFQGREKPIVIYSMTSSSPEEAPRGMSFLYDPHRLNVATSRAQCLSVLVGSPKLFEPDCHSVDQMRRANGLCRYREMAKELIIG